MQKQTIKRESSPFGVLPIGCRWLGSIVLAAILSFTAHDALAQKATLKGTVHNSDGTPAIGASVKIKGTVIGTVTDAQGQFSFTTEVKENTVLVVSLFGAESQEIVVGAKRQFDITLKDATTITEVVVTGFQNIKKANFTGASTKVMAEDLKVKGIVDISRALEGQVAGVSIQNVSGTFGTAPKVRIRGVSSINGDNKPLWVIDGVVHEDIVNVSNDDLTSGDPTTLLGSAVAGLNSNDIESIDILKDASAIALYGARAMNGVIVVTTKRGTTDGRPVVRYSGNFSVTLKPTYANYDIMNSADQMSVYNDLYNKGYLDDGILNKANWGLYGKMYQLIHRSYDPVTGNPGLENTPEAKAAYLKQHALANTDWFDVLFRNSLLQEHSLSISSGSSKSRFYGSMSFMDDSGWSVADRVSRYTGNMRQDVTLGRFTLGYQLVGSIRQQEAPGTISRTANVVEGSYDRDFDINPFSYALNTSRVMVPFDENGNYEYYQRNYAPFNILDELENNKIKLNVIDFKMQVESGYKIMEGLNWDFVGAYRYVKSDREHMITENSNMANAYRAADNEIIRSNNRYLYSDPDNPGAANEVVLPYGGIYNRDENLLKSFDFRNSINFNTSIYKNNLNFIIGQQVKMADRQNFSNTGYGYQYDRGGTVMLDYRILKQMVEKNFAYYDMGYTRDRFAAFYAKVDYDYDRRYVFSANVRYDGSNRLGKSSSARWLPTWTVSGKWNLQEEHFMENQRWLNYAAVRLSYGLVATMPPAANASAIFLDEITNRPSASEKEGITVLDQLQNDDLTWEKSYSSNLGFDLSLLNYRIDLVLDLWKRKSFDLISSYRVSGIGGSISKKANYANMDAHGIDISLGGTPVKTGNFLWRVNFTMGYSTNEITEAQNLPRIFDMVTPTGGSLEGYPVNSLFSIQYVGLGDVDVEHPDGTTGTLGVPLFINENNQVSHDVYLQSTSLAYLKYEGPVDPPYTGGLSNTFKWKSLSLNVFLTFQAGNVIRLDPVFKTTYSDLDAMPGSFYDRWVLSGDQTNIPSIVSAYEYSLLSGGIYPFNNYNYSTEMVAKGDFIRLKTLSLTYTLPEKFVRRIGLISNLSATLAASNMWMLYQDKRLNGQDPEFYNSGGVASPLQKQITFALNISF